MLLLSPVFLFPSLLLLVILTLVRRLRSPLARLPGPRYSLFTSLLIKWAEFHAQRTRFVHDLHLRYGPVVRIAPNEVSFSSAAAVKEIYCSGGSGYDKTEFYNLFTVYGRRTMFSTLNKDAHARRKRALADRYANSNVTRGESIEGIEERGRRFVHRVEGSRGDEVDIYTALHAYAFDCASHHIFHPLGADSLRQGKDEEIMLEVTSDSSLQNRLVRYYSPTLHSIISSVLNLIAPPRDTPLADNFVLDATDKGSEARPFTLMSRLSDKAWDLESTTVAAECLDHMVAGIDTTGDALCFLMWELSQPRSSGFQDKMRAELRARGQSESWDKLSYLDAVVMEGLRCYPAIPMSLPRYVPAGGRTIDGYFIPEHTIVSSQAYSVHRIDETVFPEPDKFNPERWLADDGKDAVRKRAFFAFANGGRGCVGKHLALAEMKILLRDVYSRYSTVPGQGMRQEMMEMEDTLISARPKAQRCLMRFVADE
ncbi:cytochrome P450 [Cryphonectria parasitica EP155]|uniref:Cytochrome P450 n=1 Tax=Cryphonectria parasitica (strain ATCC 38755 / EP155) TaxID=660469 RepID=A0A9P5CT39_CRYP1|nr:cytochrome P450 [Cryphonectria parasitica EP155]KAF3769923.1 cytochrome P450 [Cryphonectria parasitica EP155]